MIKAIIFDFFGVLVASGLDQFYDEYCRDPQRNKKAKDLIRSFNSGLADIRYDEVIAQLAKLGGVSEEHVRQYLDDNRPNRKLLDYIKNNLKKTYKVSILSNAGADWINELLDKNDVRLFDDIVLSYQHGMTKPSMEIYLLAAKRLGLEPKECIFIDDAQRHCLAAEEAGMKAIMYQSFGQMEKELEELLSTGSDN